MEEPNSYLVLQELEKKFPERFRPLFLFSNNAALGRARLHKDLLKLILIR